MFTLTRSRATTLALGLTLGAGVLSPLSATAVTPVPTGAASSTSAVTELVGPVPLGEVTARPRPSEQEAASLAAAATGLPQYTIADLGGGHAGFAAEVNEHGVIAGTIFPEGSEAARDHAVPAVWQGGIRTALDAGAAPSPIVHAGAIGDDGTVGGWEYDAATGTRYAVRWERDDDGGYGPMERISEVRHSTSDGSGGEVQTISPSGVLHVTAPKQHVATYSDLLWEDGSITEVGGIPGQYPYVETWDMNETQQLAGSLSTGSRLDAATWAYGSPQVLPRLVDGSYLNQALALNDQGDVVVESFNPDASEEAGQDRRVIAVGQGDSWTRLPELYGNDDRDSNLLPTDINNRGDVVGEALIGFSDRETTFAWLYRDGVMIDLNTLVPAVEGWELNAAYSINERGQIVGVGTRNGVRRPFLLDPTRPLVFVPGAGASILKSYEDPARPRELWVGCGEDRMRLSTFPEDLPAGDVRAVDATRYLDCYGVDGRKIPMLDAYGTMLDRLTGRYGYREYQVDEHVERFTTDGCDLSQRSEAPNLFVFAYDWRQDNRLSAEQLADYIGCIKRFYPDTEIDVLTHSMGSLVARRHILNNPGRTNFHKVVTVGAPWLGAPKLVNVLNTGDFAFPVAYGPDVAHIVSGFAAAHQLMSGPLYHQYAGAAFEEDGWDYDGDGEDYEEYDWANLEETFDRRWSRTTPAATAAQFQNYGGADGQADWSADSSGIDYVHIYGEQSGQNTLGRTVATTETDCSWLPPFRCVTRNIFESTMTVGDGTVPTWSADRLPPGADLNAPGAKLVRIDGTNWWDDHSVEHTTLTRHPDALRAMIAAFHDQDGQLEQLAATTDESSAPTPYRYVTVTGAADVVLSDGRGNSDAPLGPGARAPLPGTQHLSQGEGSELVTMPRGVDHPWTVTFTGRGDPMSLGMVAGTQSSPGAVVRWRDLVLEGGQVAELVMTPTGAVTLRVDSDDDGVVDEVVPPTSDVSGPDAADTEAPVVSLSQTPVLGQQRMVINATDGRDGSGVETIWYSTDRGTFQEYQDSFTAPTSATVLAFAEDRAGNRSAMATLDVAAAYSGPLTRAVLDPAPNEAGWIAGTTTARLVAAAGDSPVVGLRWRSTGAQPTDETFVEGASTEVPVTEPGRTTLSFQAVAADGTVEPWREQVVRLDARAPTSRLRAPAPGAVVSSLSQLAGTAADDASGVQTVEVLLERTGDTSFWDGASWEAARTWLEVTGTTTWRTTSMPTGADFTPGGYAVRVRVADRAGRVVTSQASTFTMAYARGLTMVGLEPAPGTAGYTSGVDLDDRGVVVGGAREESPTRWTNGSGTVLQLPPGIPKVVLSAIGPDGSISGHVPASTTPGGHAVRWDPSGTPHVLPSLPGDPSSMRTNDISAAGVVGSTGSRPVWWPTDDRVVPLTLPPGYLSGSAAGIDDHGTIVGSVVSADRTSRAAVWTEEGRTLTVLGTLGGANSYATAINDVGQVVGTSQIDHRAWRPFVLDLWSGTAMTQIYVPTEGTALPHDIADDGTIVGEYEVAGERRGFAIVDGTFRPAHDLVSDPAWSVHSFRAINELGQLTGFGWNGTQYGGFMATTPHAPVAQDAVVDTDAGVAAVITLTATDPDPGTTLTRTLVDGPAHGTLSAITGEQVTYTPDAGFDGTDTFTWRSHDTTFGSNVATVTVRVRPGADTNQRPVAVVTAVEIAPEGGVVQLDASASYDADGTVVSYAWDLDEDGEHDDASGINAELAVPREGLHEVSLRVTDGAGATGTAAISIRVVNVAPLVSAPPTVDAEVGQAVEVAGSFTDPGADDWTATFDTGDGHAPLALDGRGFRVTATFDEPGDHPVEVRVCDGTDCGSAITVVTVSERLDARIEAPTTAQEGDRVEVDGTGSIGSPTAYAWDLDGDGDYGDATGETASVHLDQDGTHTVGLRLTDADGRHATATHAVEVSNVIPVVAIPATSTALAGQPWTLTGSFTDPGDDEWTAKVDTGDGARPLPVSGRSFQATHIFAAAGTRLVPFTVCDDDGCSSASTVVTINAVWPWQGFFAPVDQMPVVNTVKAGQAIPMKFSLGGDRGLAIFAEGSPVSVRHGCDTSGAPDAIETTVTPGASALTYSASSDRYQYVWKTQKAWAGQCRTFRMTLVDGSVHEAEFRLR